MSNKQRGLSLIVNKEKKKQFAHHERRCKTKNSIKKPSASN